MKRLWIGITVLAVLLFMGIGLSVGLSKLHGGLAETLAVAAQTAREGDMETAAKLGDEAAARWERWRRFSAAITRHEPLEEMDGMFAQMALYRQLERPVDYAAVCIRLSELSRAIGESHTLTWWNFL